MCQVAASTRRINPHSDKEPIKTCNFARESSYLMHVIEQEPKQNQATGYSEYPSKKIFHNVSSEPFRRAIFSASTLT